MRSIQEPCFRGRQAASRTWATQPLLPGGSDTGVKSKSLEVNGFGVQRWRNNRHPIFRRPRRHPLTGREASSPILHSPAAKPPHFPFPIFHSPRAPLSPPPPLFPLSTFHSPAAKPVPHSPFAIFHFLISTLRRLRRLLPHFLFPNLHSPATPSPPFFKSPPSALRSPLSTFLVSTFHFQFSGDSVATISQHPKLRFATVIHP